MSEILEKSTAENSETVRFGVGVPGFGGAGVPGFGGAGGTGFGGAGGLGCGGAGKFVEPGYVWEVSST